MTPTDPPRYGVYCECGAPKPSSSATMCERRRFLDGATPGNAAVIASLRLSDEPLTMTELGRETGVSNRNLIRVVQRLKRQGRLSAMGEGTAYFPFRYALVERRV